MFINLSYLKAVNVAASDEKTRYYLNGVCLQASRENGIILVATDGHRLMAIRQTENYDGDEINIIIPRAIIDAIKIPKGIPDGELTKIDDTKWSLDIAGVATTFAPVDGIFPDWRRVVPETCDGTPATFNTAYYGDFGKVAKILGKNAASLSIIHNGPGPSLVDFGDDIECFGVIMPLRHRVSHDGYVKPSWAK
jgi:DNA polymerase-3 subunit beta